MTYGEGTLSPTSQCRVGETACSLYF